MTDPDASVILCVRNGANVISRQLDAIDAQQGHTTFELVIVDNGSTDGTRAVIEKWIANGNRRVKSVKLVDAGERAGIPYARNRGIAAAAGRVLMFCDADDEIDVHWVEAMTAGTPPHGIAGGRVLAQTADGQPRHHTFPDGLINHGYLPFTSGCNMAGSRSAILAVGGYDESLPPYGYDDVDFSWRAQLAGLPIAYVEDAIVHMTLSSSPDALRKRFLLGKGRILMAARYPGYDSTRYTVKSCLTDVARIAAHTARSARCASNAERTALASQLVSGVGRLWGQLNYNTFGKLPNPRTLSTTESDASTKANN